VFGFGKKRGRRKKPKPRRKLPLRFDPPSPALPIRPGTDAFGLCTPSATCVLASTATRATTHAAWSACSLPGSVSHTRPATDLRIPYFATALTAAAIL
jgi:hypothetical protein